MGERILILFNEPVLPKSHPDADAEHDVLLTVDVVRDILRGGGFEVGTLGIGEDLPPLLDALRFEPPDAVFNLFEGLADRLHTETTVAGVLEWFGMPFTGCGMETLTIARDKPRTKHLLHGAGLPTAAFYQVDQLPGARCSLEWPVIVKPAGQDASIGIEQASVVTNQVDLDQRVETIMERYGPPVLVERFVHGREFHVHVIEDPPDESGMRRIQMLRPTEIEFLDSKRWPIVSYHAKWNEASEEFQATPFRMAVELPAEVHGSLSAVTIGAFRLLGCRDYARIDLRLSPAGEPAILEVNPNPYIDCLGLKASLNAIGRRHEDFVCNLARAALARRTLAKQGRTLE